MRILKDGKVIRRGATSVPPHSDSKLDTKLAFAEMIAARLDEMSPEEQTAPFSEVPDDLMLMLRALKRGWINLSFGSGMLSPVTLMRNPPSSASGICESRPSW